MVMGQEDVIDPHCSGEGVVVVVWMFPTAEDIPHQSLDSAPCSNGELIRLTKEISLIFCKYLVWKDH